MDNLQRIERRDFEYCPESAYIHKYYLAKDFYKAVTRQDIDAVFCFFYDEFADEARAMIAEGVTISYNKDIGCEKYLKPAQVRAVSDAVRAYYADW